MSHRYIDHTAEVELRIEAESAEEVVAEVPAAVAELLGELDPDAPAATERVEVEAPDRPALLAAFVEELAYLAEVRGFIPERIAELDLAERAVQATVEGRAGRPHHLVKAVTLHGLRFERAGDRWEAAVVLDV